MIDRYSRAAMKEIWHSDSRFRFMKDVEIAVAEAQAEEGMIPKIAAQNIKKKAKFDIDRILELEKVTRHDVIAFVSNMAENVGKDGRYIHYGLTSSDVLDTALSLQVKASYPILRDTWISLEKSLRKLVEKHSSVLCAGRTHGMHAEPTSFGFKMAGFLSEWYRNQERMLCALQNFQVVKLSGAVGTYSFLGKKIETSVGKKLGLRPEAIATQVVPRDRHAEVLNSFALCAGFIERLAVELRHLQRTEVNEAIECFRKGQKGSSAMPHKKNPISSENLTGQARMLRSFALVGLENIALWHERDISHSATERMSFADAFVLLDYSLDRLSQVLNRLEINEKQMRKNMELSQGMLFSSHLLLALVQKGETREDAYKKVQSLAHSLQENEQLHDLCVNDAQVSSLLSNKEIQDIFSGKKHQKEIHKHLKQFLAKKRKLLPQKI